MTVPVKLTRADKIIKFCETYLLAPEGDMVGQKLVLLEFQKKFIREVYSDNGVRTAILSVGRKNGKSCLIAALLLAHICGPEAIQNSSLASGAMSKEQASLVFELARRMVESSPILSKLVRVQPSGKRLIGLKKNVTYKAMSAEAKTAHGNSIAFLILDELGQVVGPTDKFVSAMMSSQGAYKSPLCIIISTQAPTDNDMLSRMIDAQRDKPDSQTVCHVYESPAELPIDDREGWAMANPALGEFRSIDDVAKQCRAAQDMPANEPEFANLILNRRVEAESPFIPRSVWEANGADPGPEPKGKVWGGLDLSSVADLTAFVAVDEEGGIHPTFWLPKIGLVEKSRKEKVPYDLWEREGYLLTTPGRAIEYEHVAQFFRGFFDKYDVQNVGFDRYLMGFLTPWLVKDGFSDAELEKFIPFGQGTVSMTPALRELEVKLCNHKLKHGNNPVLNMCCANTKVVGDSSARKFDKKKQRGRIDGMSALANAVGVMPTEVTGGKSFWETA